MNLKPEINRKVFHLLGLVYVAVLLYLPPETGRNVLGAMAAAAFILDYGRLKIKPAGDLVQRMLGKFIRPEEYTHLSGAPWMALGAFMVSVILPSRRLQAASVLFLIIGDSAASLLGPVFGGPFWVSSKKRVSGSAACLVTSILAGFLVMWPVFGWMGIVGGAIVATVAEASGAKLNDNLLMPLMSAVFFRLIYF